MPSRKSDSLSTATNSVAQLVRQKDKAMQGLFTKALNLYVDPKQAEKSARVRLEELRKAIDGSVK